VLLPFLPSFLLEVWSGGGSYTQSCSAGPDAVKGEVFREVISQGGGSKGARGFIQSKQTRGRHSDSHPTQWDVLPDTRGKVRENKERDNFRVPQKMTGGAACKGVSSAWGGVE